MTIVIAWLADSYMVLQPILVRSQPGEQGVWQIIAGERRWRAPAG
mgnify:CR=1 FL=1